ncbi:MAG: glycosyltransferase family 2 protein [Desulfomonile tiedjei]|nr:glycosyltransferase family 2 protein [Desulfomonile tiedjei]
MNKSTVDLIIPCYNTGLYLRQAVGSALAQTYPHVNILVVDDGSTDSTREIVESYGEGVGYFHQENKGLAAARNIGMTQTRGEFVCLLDADDALSIVSVK